MAQDAQKPAPDLAAVTTDESLISNAERLALDLRSIDLDMHLNADSGAVTTRARIHLKNSSTLPLTHIALQVSSRLRWESATLLSPKGETTRLPLQQTRITTDADHTGAASELTLALTKPISPGSEVALDLYYSGTLAPSAERLLRLGAPDNRAAAADWDAVSPSFTGLRGFGNVLWYPVAAPAVLLVDGPAFAKAVDAERQRTAATTFALTLKLEHTGAARRTAWFLDQPAELASALRLREDTAPKGEDGSENGDEQTSIDSARWDAAPLNGRPVSLFIAENGAPVTDAPLHMIGAEGAAQTAYLAAAQRVLAVLKPWLPARSPLSLTVLDLPAPGTQAFADGPLLVAPVRAGDTAALAEALAYPLAAAAVPPASPAWLREGLPEFLRLLYLESTAGRDRMLAELSATTPALREAEAARGMDPAPLATCFDAPCARTKAAYALVMLRGLAGDAALEQALAATLASVIDNNESSPLKATRQFEAALTQTSGKDLAWFFRDWFDADKGLPDLTIVQVAPRRVERGAASITAPKVKRPVGGPIGAEPEAEPDDPRRQSPTAASRNTAGLPEGSWLVAVEVQNNGDAAAEVPVTVRNSGLQNSLPLRVPAHGRATIRVPFEAAPDEVWVNDGSTPEQRAGTHHRSITFTSPQ